MPELPEVETTARDLAAQVTGLHITAVEKLDWERMVETPDPASFRQLLQGRHIRHVGRRAKWLLLTLDADWTLALHLRMSGSLGVRPADHEADAHTHLVLALENGQRILFHDTRKFGRARLLDPAGLAVLDRSHGLEPLGDAFTVAALADLLARRRTRIKPLLLNQTVVAGLGNIYVDESLWQAQVHPTRPADSLSSAEHTGLHAAIQAVLAKAIANQGSTLRDYRTGYGQRGSNQDHFAVYQRDGQPCQRCGTPIVRVLVAQRGTHLCPRCQVLPAS
jgi:formamidopyrimidine-DNA glycosylase